MMIFDKNAKRIRELLKKDPEKYSIRIKELQSHKDWYVQIYSNDRKLHAFKCPPEYQSELGAKKYEAVMISGQERGESIITSKNHISDLCDFYLEDKLRKAKRLNKFGGYNSSKTICKHIKDQIGNFTFQSCLKNPTLLQYHINNLSKNYSKWQSKTIWNYYKILKAIFNFWIEKKLLTVRNPMDAVDEPPPDTNIIDYVPTQEDYERIIATALTESIDINAIRLIGAARYSGLRINEILNWKVEDIVLNPSEGIPYFWANISKQRSRTRKAIPMVRQLYDILKDQIGLKTEGSIWPWKNPPYKLLRIKGISLYKIAGVDVPRPFHDFRKTVKMGLKRSGMSKEITKGMQGCGRRFENVPKPAV
jgi:integrase